MSSTASKSRRNSDNQDDQFPNKRPRKLPSESNYFMRENRKSSFDATFTTNDERRNSLFEEYYRCQRVVPDHEFPQFMRTFSIPLPSSFRIVAHSAYSKSIQENLLGNMSQLFRDVAKTSESNSNDLKLKAPMPIPWYPDRLAWSVSIPRQMLRRDNVLSPFHKFLVSMHQIGAINRQEAVSMIPPLLLDVRQGHSIIDMCAAPGSKTAQILELVSSYGKHLSCPGVVIANDADTKRCWMLAHQLKRFGSAELVVTNHKAQFFPKIMNFDRVLCDVPCTGDGTLRKAPDIWRRWNPQMGIAMHRLQIQIVERGVDLLRPGGRLVYSTCSMNPIENEAVVAHVLREYGNDIELVDCSKRLPQLVRRDGLTSWLVAKNYGNRSRSERSGKQYCEDRCNSISDETNAIQNKNGENWFQTFEEVPQGQRFKVVRSLFPPSAEELASGKFPLRFCLRIVPHDQDTGAFFVAVFQKKALMQTNQFAACPEPDENVDAVSDPQHSGRCMTSDFNIEKNTGNTLLKDGMESSKEQQKHFPATEETLVSVKDVAPEILRDIVKYYGLTEHVGDNYLLTRGADWKSFKRIVAVSRTARTVIRHAMGSRDKVVESKNCILRVVNAGVRVLERTDRKNTPCLFRLVQDGVAILRQMMKSRVMEVDVAKATKLLEEKTIRTPGYIGCMPNDQSWNRIIGVGSGSAVLFCNDENIIVWIGTRSVSVMMPDEIVKAMLLRIKRL